jgi:uncharacterized membrane protein YgcG
MDRNSTRLLVVPALAGIAFILTGALVTGSAQTLPPDPPAARLESQQTQTFTADQLTDLVAPIALYPDGLLSQVLVASTYPLEVVEAQQWLQRNPTLRGTQLTNAAKQQPWDPSVQALVAFPDVLNRLNQDVAWTRDLGDAFLAQQADVMAAVQRLRASAQANGRLTTTPQQTVSTETQGGQPAIVIQPASPDVIYVPVYDPAYIWGPPVWGYYPSLYYPAFGFGWGPGINLGFCFGGWNGWGGWGWGPNWFGRTIIVNNNFFHHYGFHGGGAGFNRAPWLHDPSHRLGIPYPNRQVAGRLQAPSMASRANSAPVNHPPVNQPNGGRNAFQGGANRMAMPGNPGNPQGFQGVSPRGGAARSFPAPQSRPTQPMPHNTPNFGGGGMRGFGGGHNFGGGYGFGGGHSFGGAGHSFGGGRSFGGGGGHGGRR